jgi:hypothetical protein
MASSASTVDDRRAFLDDVDDHVGVRETDFTRDGFQTIFVQFEAGEAGFEDIVADARDLGYEYERVGPRLYRFEVRE